MRNLANLAAASLIPAILISGCAKSPDSIAPAYTSPTAYNGWSCQQLAEENVRVSHALATASAQQNNARTGDIVGVALIGMPVSTLSGDNIAPQIADLKGQRDALMRARLDRKC